MKKRLISLGLVVAFVLGIGNVVYANSETEGWGFEEMLPFMKQMHPEMNEQEMEQMYQNCHGSSDEVPMNKQL